MCVCVYAPLQFQLLDDLMQGRVLRQACLRLLLQQLGGHLCMARMNACVIKEKPSSHHSISTTTLTRLLEQRLE